MLETQRCLAAYQSAKAPAGLTLAGTAQAPSADALELFRRRNAALDAFFYDLKVITEAEAASIAPWAAPEGSILIVPPCGQGAIIPCADIEAFARAGGAGIRVLSIAGVGSSALGTAAFARNIATALNQPVAAVVSGYGMADVMAEAMGGWFWFRTVNGLRHLFERLEEASRPATGPQGFMRTANGAARHGSDMLTLFSLLMDPRFSFSLVTGHSKGNLVIAEALFAIGDADSARQQHLGQHLWVVTVSAAIYMPAIFKDRIVDVIGGIDWFGGMNSRWDLGIEIPWPLSWHHTNTQLRFHLPVTDVFRTLARNYPFH